VTRQRYFETKQLERSKRADTERRTIEERRRLATIGALQRMRQLDLKNAATLLDYSIETELQSSLTRDPRHVAFSMAARALMARRDNLRATIKALSEELARSNHLERVVA
jgi:hypothetical protein